MAKPRPFPLRTVVLVALVPLVGFTIFVVATHRESPAPSSRAAPSAARPTNVIFVTPVSGTPAKPAE